MEKATFNTQQHSSKISNAKLSKVERLEKKIKISKNDQLKSVDFCDIQIRGDLAYRSNLNFSRLEGEEYRPESVFQSENYLWPGDWEGRTILALTLLAKATHRTPAFLDSIVARLLKKLNAKGYLGNIIPDGIADEQQIAGHSWLIRGLIEYYDWTKNKSVLSAIRKILNNVILPLRGQFKDYPIDPEERAACVSGKWRLSTVEGETSDVFNMDDPFNTADTGCGFIMLDGASEAYRLFHEPAIKDLIEEMIDRFSQIDFVKIQTQTHATLTALRGILKFYELEKNDKHLSFVKRVFDLYKTEAWTENYGNYNWFGSPKLTEGCAIVDSIIVAVGLWKHTGNNEYLEDAHHIYFNSLSFAQRATGALGCDNCVGTQGVILKPHFFEVYWCCTMRGGEGFARMIEFNFFTNGDKLVVPFYNNCTADLYFADSMIKLNEQTDYPNRGNVSFKVIESTLYEKKEIKLFAPSWTSQGETKVYLNGSEIDSKFENGFVIIKTILKRGDNIEFDLSLDLHTKGLLNKNNMAELHTFRHGPLILACQNGQEEIKLAKDSVFESLGGGKYCVKNTDIILSPINDITSLAMPESKRQILFEGI